MKIDAQMIEGFVTEYLLNRYDESAPIPDCHREWWDWYCDPALKGALAAPRNHGKSTAVTHAAVLCEALFGAADHFLIVSETEEQAIQFLGDLKVELRENEKLAEDFGIDGLVKDTETDIICRCNNGLFRIIAKGSEQKIRGRKWRGKRPNRVVMDDGESDEQVESKPRRLKFNKWFQNALMQAGSKSCKYRVIGTVLHMDSQLERLLNSKFWLAKRYQANDDEFKTILWPERWPREALMNKRAEFVADGDLAGYNMEYRNMPVSDETSKFPLGWFTAMDPKALAYFERRSERSWYVPTDLAVSTESHADWSVFGIVGVDDQNYMNLCDVIRDRMDSYQIVEELFRLEALYHPIFIMEKGVIEKSLGPVIKAEMVRRGIYLHIETIASSKEKEVRAKGIQKIMRSGGLRFNKEAPWYADFEEEVHGFTKKKYDDQVDMLSLLGLHADKILASDTQEEIEEDEYQNRGRETPENEGRDLVTGY